MVITNQFCIIRRYKEVKSEVEIGREGEELM